VEAIGGEVTSVHYNRLALRQLLRPQKFEGANVKLARPPPKMQPYYTSWNKRGYLNPAVQMREWLRTSKPELQDKFEEIMAVHTNSDDGEESSDNQDESNDTEDKNKH
jgi:hypothetical protein